MTNKGPKTLKGIFRKVWSGDGRTDDPATARKLKARKKTGPIKEFEEAVCPAPKKKKGDIF